MVLDNVSTEAEDYMFDEDREGGYLAAGVWVWAGM
jgi:hypothetical protein